MNNTNKILLWVSAGILVILLCVGGYFFIKYRDYVSENQSLSCQFAEQQKIVKRDSTTWELLALEVKSLKYENETLKKTISKAERSAYLLANMKFDFNGKKDTIITVVKDTVSKVRMFAGTYLDGIYLAGSFEPYNPYRLFIDSLKASFGIDVALSEDNDNKWFYDIVTSSKYLVPKYVNVQVRPKEKVKRIGYYYGAGLHGNFSGSLFKGITVDGGFTYDTYGGGIYVGNFEKSGYFGIKIYKFGVF